MADGNIRKRFVTYKQAAELYSMGMNRIQEHAKAAGATYKMGNKVLINTDIFDLNICHKIIYCILNGNPLYYLIEVRHRKFTH